MNKRNPYIVESIPIGMEALEGTEDVRYTKDVLTDLTNKAKETIDLTAMYWTLKPNPERPDEAGFTEEQFREMGGDYGKALFDALVNAAKRGVKIRILQSSGFENNGKKKDSDENEEKQEWAELAEYKEQVKVRQIDLKDWYDGGMMHQKIWVFDNKDIYLGSANMDWRALTQVKEMGITLEDQPDFAKDVTRYFDGWWQVASMEPPKKETVFDHSSGFTRTVPAWSLLVTEEKRIPSPLGGEESERTYNMEKPGLVVLNGQHAEAFITGCPREFCASGRTYDCDALVKTIMEAQKNICISVMDFVPVSLFRGELDIATGKSVINGQIATAAWWPVLFNALIHAVITNGARVRLLVSKWKYTRFIMDPFLRALRETASAGWANYSTTCGSLEIRLFYVPGWHSTLGPDRLYPGHTRVNHAKYIVTDQRVNIGTSNMTWDYFFTSAGTSFNSNHPDLVKKVQEIFNRDWKSEYAYPF
jgi:phospholipase D3/4